MSLYTTKYLLITFVVVGALAYVAALKGFKEFDVSQVADKTMCPIKEEIDDDPQRTPRRIKFLKCAEQPNPMCKDQNMPDGCCRNLHGEYRTECVEIYEFMEVLNKGTEELTSIRVPVGCNCLIEKVIIAEEVDRTALNDTEVI